MSHIVHICNNYISSKVHQQLVQAIEKKDTHQQSVFVPVRDKGDMNKNKITNAKHVEYRYFNYRFKILRFLQFTKITLIFLVLRNYLKHKKVDLIIAHNFWSDGMVAYLYHLLNGTPYVLAVRSTDLKLFIPKLRPMHFVMKSMIKRSEGLVFINPAYQQTFEKHYPQLHAHAKKTEVIYNGVASFWLQNIHSSKSKTHQFLYVGTFEKRKHLAAVCEAMKHIHSMNHQAKLVVIGNDEAALKTLLGTAHIPDYIEVIGKVYDQHTLLDYYRQAEVFVMPSINETFGLVYIEALLQGCRVLHADNEGIAGIFDSKFVQSVNPTNIDALTKAMHGLLSLEHDQEEIQKIQTIIQEKCNWNNVSSDFLKFIP